MCMPREPLVFGQPRRSTSLEEGLNLERDVADVVPPDTGSRIEIDAKLVGVIGIVGADGVRMELEAAEVHDPGKPGGVIDDHLLGSPAGGKGKRHGAEPVGPIRGRALLVEGSPSAPSTKRLSTTGRSRIPPIAPSETAR